jgi:hypothetical protein
MIIILNSYPIFRYPFGYILPGYLQILQHPILNKIQINSPLKKNNEYSNLEEINLVK